ncbi:unnamed protein product [Litomosoides sigmodontis]|uniref:XLF-like N-terminal domain-containing protein n=1 Tax=Litomosoides sigmodontis TaxID=42156 RepID=A0A3P6THF5_LITSI|nr:unnamed protein product [Litomosoides sigmodontis]
MESRINAELLKTCWAPLGFKLGNQHYAAKFHVEAGQLHIILTDYECIYYEIADFTKKFSSLNAKLGGPEKTLLEKIYNMFVSSATKVSYESKNDNALEFNLEAVAGKRTLKWHFSGQRLDSTNYVTFPVSSHITRPLLNMLSIIVDECDLNSIKAPVFGTNFNDLFGKSSIQKLYQAVVMKSLITENVGDTKNEGGNEININTDTGGSNKNSIGSFPLTPPPASTYEVMSDTDQDKEITRIQTVHESPQKKPRLRF